MAMSKPDVGRGSFGYGQGRKNHYRAPMYERALSVSTTIKSMRPLNSYRKLGSNEMTLESLNIVQKRGVIPVNASNGLIFMDNSTLDTSDKLSSRYLGAGSEGSSETFSDTALNGLLEDRPSTLPALSSELQSKESSFSLSLIPNSLVVVDSSDNNLENTFSTMSRLSSFSDDKDKTFLTKGALPVVIKTQHLDSMDVFIHFNKFMTLDLEQVKYFDFLPKLARTFTEGDQVASNCFQPLMPDIAMSLKQKSVDLHVCTYQWEAFFDKSKFDPSVYQTLYEPLRSSSLPRLFFLRSDEDVADRSLQEETFIYGEGVDQTDGMSSRSNLTSFSSNDEWVAVSSSQSFFQEDTFFMTDNTHQERDALTLTSRDKDLNLSKVGEKLNLSEMPPSMMNSEESHASLSLEEHGSLSSSIDSGGFERPNFSKQNFVPLSFHDDSLPVILSKKSGSIGNTLSHESKSLLLHEDAIQGIPKGNQKNTDTVSTVTFLPRPVESIESVESGVTSFLSSMRNMVQSFQISAFSDPALTSEMSQHLEESVDLTTPCVSGHVLGDVVQAQSIQDMVLPNLSWGQSVNVESLLKQWPKFLESVTLLDNLDALKNASPVDLADVVNDQIGHFFPEDVNVKTAFSQRGLTVLVVLSFVNKGDLAGANRILRLLLSQAEGKFGNEESLDTVSLLMNMVGELLASSDGSVNTFVNSSFLSSFIRILTLEFPSLKNVMLQGLLARSIGNQPPGESGRGQYLLNFFLKSCEGIPVSGNQSALFDKLHLIQGSRSESTLRMFFDALSSLPSKSLSAIFKNIEGSSLESSLRLIDLLSELPKEYRLLVLDSLAGVTGAGYEKMLNTLLSENFLSALTKENFVFGNNLSLGDVGKVLNLTRHLSGNILSCYRMLASHYQDKDQFMQIFLLLLRQAVPTEETGVFGDMLGGLSIWEAFLEKLKNRKKQESKKRRQMQLKKKKIEGDKKETKHSP